MKLPARILFFSLTLFLLSLIAGYWYLPAILQSQTARFAPLLGLDSLELKAQRPGLGSMYFDSIQFTRGLSDKKVLVMLSEVELSISWAALFSKRLPTIVAERIEVRLAEQSSTRESENSALPVRIQTLAETPFVNLSVESRELSFVNESALPLPELFQRSEFALHTDEVSIRLLIEPDTALRVRRNASSKGLDIEMEHKSNLLRVHLNDAPSAESGVYQLALEFEASLYFLRSLANNIFDWSFDAELEESSKLQMQTALEYRLATGGIALTEQLLLHANEVEVADWKVEQLECKAPVGLLYHPEGGLSWDSPLELLLKGIESGQANPVRVDSMKLRSGTEAQLTLGEAIDLPLRMEFGAVNWQGRQLKAVALDADLSLDAQLKQAAAHFSLQIPELGTAVGSFGYDSLRGNTKLSVRQPAVASEKFLAFLRSIDVSVPQGYSFSGGTMAIEANLKFAAAHDSEQQYRGVLALNDIALKHNQFVARGISARLPLSYSKQLEMHNAELTIASLNPGVELSELVLDFDAAFSASPEIQIQSATAKVLGGELSLGASRILLKPFESELQFLLKGASLEKIASLYPSAGIQASGTLDAQLPLRIDSEGFGIRGGTVQNRGDGRIAWSAATERASGALGQQLGVLAKVLENYHFTTLQSGVTLNETGDLKLSVSLKGSNPDFQNAQAVHLNVQLEENVPALLKSARIAHNIGAGIEQGLRGNQ